MKGFTPLDRDVNVPWTLRLHDTKRTDFVGTKYSWYLTGFTLIETIIYIALLGLLMAGAVAVAYGLMASASQTNTSTATVDEGSFVSRKLLWALVDISATPTVAGSGCAQTVRIMKTGYVHNPIEMERNVASDTIEMREGGAGPYIPLTTRHTRATCLQFQIISTQSGAPAGLTATTTIDGTDFGVTRYMRI